MTVFACMPDELSWDLTPRSHCAEVREVIAQQQARELARVSAPPEPEQEPELSLYAWRRPGTRREVKIQRCKRFAIR